MLQHKDVFISYHMDSSTDIVEKISAALDGMGISNWYAKKDIDGSYAGAIIEAINHCKVFLLILNQYSSASAHCLNEINAVFDRLSKQENVVILPFRIDKCELSKDAYYYLGRIRMFDGTLPPEMERVGELVDRISAILGRHTMVEKSVQNYVTKEVKNYRLIGSTVSKSSSFVGRKAELEDLHAKLECYPHKVFLVGMGGIGKSEIAKAYCDMHRDAYDVVLWVSFDESLQKTINNDFSFPIQGIDRSDFPEDDDTQYFMRKLKVLKEITDKRVLIVLDNFDVFEDENLEQFCSGNYSVLFTTRYREIKGDGNEVEIKEITDEAELMELFSIEYKKNLDSAATEEVKRLLKMLGGHPLSIRLVASAMKSNRISPDMMIKVLQKSAAASEKKGEKAAEMIKTRLQGVFTVSALVPEEIDVLKNLSLMPLSGIDVEAFYEWCGFEDYDVIDGLIQKSWVVHNCTEDKVHLHPIVKDVMIEELEKDPSACNLLIDSLTQEIKELRKGTFEARRRLYECFGSANYYLPKTHPRKWDVKYGNAIMIKMLSRYDEASAIMGDLYHETEDITKQMSIQNEISHGYCLTGRPNEGIAEAEKGLVLIEGLPLEALTPEQRHVRKNLYTRIQEANRTLGNLEYAEKCMRMVIADSERFPDETSSESMGWYYLHIARVLAQSGSIEKYKESEQFIEKCLDQFEKAENASAIGYGYMVYGMLRMYEGRYEEALEHNAKAMKIIEETMGAQHTDLGKLKLFEANIYRAKGDEETAILCYRQAEEMMVQRNNPILAQKVREVMESGVIGYTN